MSMPKLPSDKMIVELNRDELEYLRFVWDEGLQALLLCHRVLPCSGFRRGITTKLDTARLKEGQS
jgi:hypothetical protein